MVDTGRDGPDPRRLGARQDDRGQGRGGDVDIAGREPKQGVAHRAADDAGLLAVPVEEVEHADDPRILEKRRADEPPVGAEMERTRHQDGVAGEGRSITILWSG